MSLWGNLDGRTGNNKPKFANTTYRISNSTINGSAANTAKFYGAVYGVAPNEQANTLARADGTHPQHAGWVSQKIGTGPIKTVTIVNGGQGYNSAGYIVVSGGGDGTVNLAYTIANSRNTLQTYSSNSYWNTIATVTVVNGGAGFNVAPTLVANGPNSANFATFSVALGGRAGRVQYETLVAMGSITGDDPGDDKYFPQSP
jgi:hypothetical protein